ncbi:RNA polymerase factor sigma-54 [Polynucleobacter sp. MWH-HuK1]|uniref:RNA polymerase factor sigma-54 n=1 Tax=Polynucleobacter sp. MWH-HuK1 TaxID=1743158 RepID=UPI001C0C11BB|nr:RNA polymerase factor sigma-54 [Polynucleobacter sp. MWH-HuK1]MBU3565266.1 RNA polymerase factor sigma-54 [Polynucleobacter sp. MWH-HuK1]
MAISLNTRISQTVSLTPQLQQSIKLLQLSNSELEQELAKEAEENPLLEFEPNPEIESNISQTSERLEINQSPWTSNHRISQEDDEDWGEQYERIAHKQTLLEYLEEQIHLLNIGAEEQSIVAYLAGCLDDRGYLPEDLQTIYADIETQLSTADSFERLEKALTKLQSLDPPGVGARNLAECLSLQINRILENVDTDRESWELAKEIASSHLSKVGTKDWQKIKQASGKTEVAVLKAVNLIRTLQHNPGSQFERENDQWILPDVVVKLKNKRWTAESNPNAKPRLSLNSEYAKILKEHGQKKIDGALKQKMIEASWLVKNITQREETILRVAQSIVSRQQQFFSIGAIGMRPLVLREIAEELEMHESTISRVTTQKYLACPLGIFEFKYFFSSQVSSENGSGISSTAIQALIKKIVGEESPNKPISDTQIAQLLGEQGYSIARRTIAKYRDILRIPPVHLRKQ